MSEDQPENGTKTKKGPRGKKGAKKKVKCALCDYTAIQGYRMKRHMRIHTGEKPFMCAMCDQSFTQKSSLKEHLWKHTALRSSHKCPHCDTVFNQLGDVKAHINHMHAAGEQMACTMCPSVFTDRYSLLQHQKTHDDMFRYQCLECAFSSRDKSKLILHMSIHNKRKPLRCSACKGTFKYRHNLLNHLYQKHDINTFGDEYVPTPEEAQTDAPEEDISQRRLTSQQELEQQYQILDEHGNALQLTEADAEAIRKAMQEGVGDDTLQIIQNEEGSMTVTVVTVAPTLEGVIHNIEEDMAAMVDDNPLEPQLSVAGEDFGEGIVSATDQADETPSEQA
ncbi:transcriptional repressor CTCF-like isoform X2 [Acanthaster planci]|uniref:Transcriptional repressor CTCF-like isoform X2 n=1 Tax=Acanthaster planci TaxID=133434 RepID=A0A8B7XV48_ACAPL|nr:transcriptional repressor CTCF-like isoform X2 [Acanthaster planci]